MTPRLKEIRKVHFPFAHFLGLKIKNDKLYALEKEGYLIVLDKNLLHYKIYEVDIPQGYVYQTKDKFIIDDEAVIIDSNETTSK